MPRRSSSDLALVLRRYPYGESSLLVHSLTREHGRVNLLAKGAYRPKSAYCGVLDLFDTLELEWKAPPGAGLGILAKGGIETRRAAIPRDTERYRSALGVLELAGLGAREGHEERELFDLTVDLLDALAAGHVDPALLGTVYELRFLAVQGLAPALASCASCGRALSDPRGSESSVRFSAALGGRLCDPCLRSLAEDGGGGRPRVEEQPSSVIRVARSLLATPLEQLSRIRMESERSARLRLFVRRFLEYHLETRPRTWGPGHAPRQRSRSLLRR